MTIRVTVWNEHRQERSDPPVAAVYPDGIHAAISAGLRAADAGLEVRTATLDEPEHGLTDAVLDDTDVLTWWGHVAHGEVTDAVVDRVHARVLDGMGLVVLHSGHFSRIFSRLMGTACDLKWREDGRRERLWVVDPSHPIADGPRRVVRPRRGGDVRRALRHPGAGRAGPRQLVRGRRGVPQRLHLAPGPGSRRVPPPGPRDPSRRTSIRTSGG